MPSSVLRHCLLVMAISAAFPASAATAEPEAAVIASVQQYNITAAELADVLSRIAVASGQNIVAEPRLVQGKRGHAVQGSYTPRQAIEQALVGTGLQVSVHERGGFVIRVASQVDGAAAVGNALPEVAVKASSLNDAVTEGTGSYTTRSMSSATKLDLSARETPQSVSVITRQRIEDQSMFTLGDALNYTTGLTVTKWGGERERFNSRGFQISNLMVDGLVIGYEEAALSTGLLSMYDRVELVRGSSGLMEGAGTPGGTISLQRKRPTREFQGSVTASAGRWDNYSTGLDIAGPLNEAGSLRGRLVMSYQDKNSFIQDYENKRSLLYGILEGDLGERTTLTLGFSWSQDNNPGADWNGIGTYLDGSFVPISRSTRMSPSWSYWDKESTTIFTELEHRFSDTWKAKLAATAMQSKADILGTFLGFANDHNPYFNLSGGTQAYQYDHEQFSIDGSLSGAYQLGGRSHEVVVGLSHRRSDDDDRGANTNYTSVDFDPLNWNPGSVPKPAIISDWHAYSRDQNVKQSAVYAMTRLNLRDDLKLILGARMNWYESELKAAWETTPYKDTRVVTPYAGLIYDLNANHSVYASWTEIFNPQNYQTPGGSLLKPQEGTNYEVGIKGEYFDKKLNASLAIFQLDLENLPAALPVAACQVNQPSCYATSGKVRSRGVDVEVQGSLTPRWQVGLGYTYNHVEVLKETEYSMIETHVVGSRWGANLPLNLFKLFTSYRLPGELDKWKVGGGIRTQSRIYTPYGVQQGGYSVADLYVSYAVDKNLELSLNGNNIFDKRYYSSISSPWGANFFGEPRNIMVTARYKF
ncbi:TonB-dependent receptor [Methylobacillus arboreus]|uniref:TonB-dependent siderophore receptor n=1 Tax=Methylobacillus arboreus TaxID=755170 RepID=UPI001E43B324|nr:TonB-dependent receptor [Methylobacillus arboreus]MCB5190931.1 TonB-dependent receptor [Methylobacillus arboreus]